MKKHDSQTVDLQRLDTYDIRGLCVHPACIISVTLTNLKSDSATRASQGKNGSLLKFGVHSVSNAELIKSGLVGSTASYRDSKYIPRAPFLGYWIQFPTRFEFCVLYFIRAHCERRDYGQRISRA